jgi:CRISPR type III-B/RAMP module RAMP protein Cmr6
MARDVADAVGAFAEKVENRSLLLDKFVFHKSWPVMSDGQGQPVKWDDASRWSFMRIANDSQLILQADASKKEQEARGRNVDPLKADRLRTQAGIARRLANVKWDDIELSELRARHTRRFLGLFESALPDRHVTLVAQLEARMAINLSDSLIQNAGICLDRLFGLPYIPGSAVKGVCRHAALEELKDAATEEDRRQAFWLFQKVFGTSEVDFAANAKSQGDLCDFVQLVPERSAQTIKGCVDFLPAYPVNHARISVDLTTVHYPDYYRSGRMEDLSVEKPRPNPFPVVAQGARFAFCLTANRMTSEPERHLEAARRWLVSALTIRGVGAKTSSGYGWFSIPGNGLAELREAERREQVERDLAASRERQALEAAERVRQEREAQAARAAQNKVDAERLKSLSPEQVADETVASWNDDAFRSRLNSFIKTKGAPSDDQKRAIVRACHGPRAPIWDDLKKKAERGGESAKIVAAVNLLRKQLKAEIKQ